MAYEATVNQVLIASPSDVVGERKLITDVIHYWNILNSLKATTVLIPVSWETHSYPEFGDRPQAIINKQIVEDSDILIGAFWTRIGTHTGVAESGTVEEIEAFIEAGKPVLLYFSSAPVAPESIEREQYDRLIEFRQKCEKAGLIGRYGSLGELREKLLRDISKVVENLTGKAIASQAEIVESYATGDALGALTSEITRARVDWTAERNSEPPDLDDGKYILDRVMDGLIDYRASMEGAINDALSSNIDNEVTKIKALKRHRLLIDGGNSYRAFWERGDEVFDNVVAVIEGSKNVGKRNGKSGVSEDEMKILLALSEMEEIGQDNSGDREISEITELSVTKARHVISGLVRKGLIHDHISVSGPVVYSLNSSGREVIVEHEEEA